MAGSCCRTLQLYRQFNARIPMCSLHGLVCRNAKQACLFHVQGYIQYRIAGEPQRLDVDTLNEQLRSRGAARMRLLMRPDEAYGMIFDFDGLP